MKFSYERLSLFLKKEWAIFLLINVVFPFAMLVPVQFFHTYLIKLAIVMGVQACMLEANIYRNLHGKQSLKWAYMIISVLNILSFLALTEMSFLTSVHSIVRLTYSYFYGPLPFWL